MEAKGEGKVDHNAITRWLKKFRIKLNKNKQHRYGVLLSIFSLDCYWLDNRMGEKSS